jgi:hypothetical protein
MIEIYLFVQKWAGTRASFPISAGYAPTGENPLLEAVGIATDNLK